MKVYFKDGNVATKNLNPGTSVYGEELIKEDQVEFSEITETLNILSKPNNILAIEYLKALNKTKSKIEPIFTTRSNSDYNSADLNGKDSSATAIRTRLLTKEKIKSIKKLVPSFTYNLMKEDIKEFVNNLAKAGLLQ